MGTYGCHAGEQRSRCAQFMVQAPTLGFAPAAALASAAGHGIGPGLPAQQMPHRVSHALQPGHADGRAQPSELHMAPWSAAGPHQQRGRAGPAYQYAQHSAQQGFGQLQSVSLGAAPAQHRSAHQHAEPGYQQRAEPSVPGSFVSTVGGFAPQPWWWQQQQQQLYAQHPQHMAPQHAVPQPWSAVGGQQPQGMAAAVTRVYTGPARSPPLPVLLNDQPPSHWQSPGAELPLAESAYQPGALYTQSQPGEQ